MKRQYTWEQIAAFCGIRKVEGQELFECDALEKHEIHKEEFAAACESAQAYLETARKSGLAYG